MHTTTGAHTEEPKTRRERLVEIAIEYTEETHDARTRRQLAGEEPVSRYAAVTSEGSPESSYSANGNLLVADTPEALAEVLRQECGEGWLVHGRVWDLDAPWHSWGNLEVAYSVSVGDGYRPPLHMVEVEGREDGTYLFEDLLDAETFVKTIRRHGDEASLRTAALHDHRGAERLIDAERER
jgi:hypothetical protein